MKNKNLITIGVIGLALYFILKKDRKNKVSDSEENGQNTVSSTKLPFSKEDLMKTNRSMTLIEDIGLTKRMPLKLVYNPPYRGGKRPSDLALEKAGKWTVTGNPDGLKTSVVAQNGMLAGLVNQGTQSILVAETKDVIDYVFNPLSDKKWNVKFGKKQGGFLDGMLPPMSSPLNTYAVPSGISLRN